MVEARGVEPLCPRLTNTPVYMLMCIFILKEWLQYTTATLLRESTKYVASERGLSAPKLAY